MSSQKPASTLCVVASVLSMGTVPSVPSTPKPISTGLLPTRTDSKSTSGCTSMNTNSEAAEVSVASDLLQPAVLTRNFWTFGCAITSAGQIVCWGDNSEAKATPPTGSDFVAIDTGGGLSCALHRTGEQACWGERFALKPDYTLPLPAVQVQVSGGSCALLQDGTQKCIGSTYPVPTLPR